MAEQGFTLSSPAFSSGAVIPADHTCDSGNSSPPLRWMHPPQGTGSFALIVDDPDAPQGTFTHWILFDIPAGVRELGLNDRDTGVSGRNDFQADSYGGPCPPPNHGVHRYDFTLYALDVETLNLEKGATREQLEQAMQGHVLEQTRLMGRYERTAG